MLDTGFDRNGLRIKTSHSLPLVKRSFPTVGVASSGSDWALGTRRGRLCSEVAFSELVSVADQHLVSLIRGR